MSCKHKSVSPMLNYGGKTLVNVCDKCGYRFIPSIKDYKNHRRLIYQFRKYDVVLNMLIINSNLIIQTIKFDIFDKKKFSFKINKSKLFVSNQYSHNRVNDEIGISKKQYDSIIIPYQSFKFAKQKMESFSNLIEQYFEKNKIKGKIINSLGKRKIYFTGNFSKDEFIEFIEDSLLIFELKYVADKLLVLDGLVYIEYDINNFEKISKITKDFKKFKKELKKYWENI